MDVTIIKIIFQKNKKNLNIIIDIFCPLKVPHTQYTAILPVTYIKRTEKTLKFAQNQHGNQYTCGRTYINLCHID
jgi:hypothetical protein